VESKGEIEKKTRKFEMELNREWGAGKVSAARMRGGKQVVRDEPCSIL
jgi:hypothetical protein